MTAPTPEQFANDAAAVRGFGVDPHRRAVELMADTLRELGFDSGVSALERQGFLSEPARFCHMAMAGEACE